MGPLRRDADTSLVRSSFCVDNKMYNRFHSTYLGATTVSERLYGLSVNIALVGMDPSDKFNNHVIENAKVEACQNCQALMIVARANYQDLVVSGTLFFVQPIFAIDTGTSGQIQRQTIDQVPGPKCKPVPPYKTGSLPDPRTQYEEINRESVSLSFSTSDTI